METAASAWSLADALEPLRSAFGDRLTLRRDGNVVLWSYDAQTIVVELRAGGGVEATFIDRPTIDAVRDVPAAAVFTASPRTAYRLSPEGAVRMVDDMVAFFSGTREPRFLFVSAYELGRAS